MSDSDNPGKTIKSSGPICVECLRVEPACAPPCAEPEEPEWCGWRWVFWVAVALTILLLVVLIIMAMVQRLGCCGDNDCDDGCGRRNRGCCGGCCGGREDDCCRDPPTGCTGGVWMAPASAPVISLVANSANSANSTLASAVRKGDEKKQ